MRKRYIQNPRTLKLELVEDCSRESFAPMIMGDISPYRSMVTGEVIGGRAQHREHLREHRLIEIGNETQRSAPPRRDSGVKQALIDSVRKHIR